jgi:hypothetical protein
MNNIFEFAMALRITCANKVNVIDFLVLTIYNK